MLVKAVEKKDEIRSGIIIPETAKEKPQEGEIIAVGKGKITEDGKLLPMDVKPGDKILYGKYSGTEVTLNGEPVLILRESDILAIVS